MSTRRRYAVPFEELLEGRALVHYAAELDRCAILSPNGQVKIGAAQLSQCVIVEPCEIADDVVARGAILQGTIGSGCHIESNADVMGELGREVYVGPHAVIEHGASVGDGARIEDHVVIESNASIGDDITVGVGARIGRNAEVVDGPVPPKTIVAPGDIFALSGPSDEAHRRGRWREGIPTLDDYDEDEDDGEDHERLSPRDTEEDDRHFYGDIMAREGAMPGKMAAGVAHAYLLNFQPGSARSWVLAKLARIANSHARDRRISKQLIKEHRPDLLEHPIVKEVLRMQPLPSDVQLNDMSWAALSQASYDVWEGVTFHSGDADAWQMVGPRSNDVFVLSVSKPAYEKLVPQPFGREPYGGERVSAENLLFEKVDWHPDKRVARPVGWVRTLIYPKQRTLLIVEVQSDRFWMKFAHGKDRDALFREYHSIIDQNVDKELKGDGSYYSRPMNLYERESEEVGEQEAHDRQERRTREWDAFLDATAEAALQLRNAYSESFASDALNVVVEWAFSHRFDQVLIFDRDSRAKLGGQPPKDYYETVPKKYAVTGLVPLPDFVDTYDWVPRAEMRVRRIVPNKRR